MKSTPLLARGLAIRRETQLGVDTAFSSPEFLLALIIGLVGGLLCVLRTESVRAFAARYSPDVTERFGGAEAHRRFIRFCGWALLALAVGLSLSALVFEG